MQPAWLQMRQHYLYRLAIVRRDRANIRMRQRSARRAAVLLDDATNRLTTPVRSETDLQRFPGDALSGSKQHRPRLQPPSLTHY